MAGKTEIFVPSAGDPVLCLGCGEPVGYSSVAQVMITSSPELRRLNGPGGGGGGHASQLTANMAYHLLMAG